MEVRVTHIQLAGSRQCIIGEEKTRQALGGPQGRIQDFGKGGEVRATVKY